jgi:hypothetical protein
MFYNPLQPAIIIKKILHCFICYLEKASILTFIYHLCNVTYHRRRYLNKGLHKPLTLSSITFLTNITFYTCIFKRRAVNIFKIVDNMYVSLILLLTITAYVHGQNASFPDCKTGPVATFPICNSALPSHQRAVDLVNRMSISEKISQMSTPNSAIPRLGLPAYEWWSEALHGLAGSNGVHFGGDLTAATSFPMIINLGATFNMTLVYRMGSVISIEARAFNNEGRAGLNFFTPNINIVRDPRWGRGAETVGEDPFLGAQYAYAFVNGLQGGEDQRYIKVAATCKHYVAYDLELWNGTDRAYFNAIVSDQDIVETHLPPFESCIRDAHAASIMCSVNEINGIPACADKFFLQTIAR